MELIKQFPEYQFEAGRFFMWSPYTRTITYDPRRIGSNNGKIALIHELGHAMLGHRIYKYDMELLQMEMDAWDIVRRLGPQFNLKIDEAHISRCIASYDEWLSKRATCPDCDNFSLQKGRQTFACFACGSTWSVNERKDRRVMRTVTSRLSHTTLAPSFGEKPHQIN